MNEVAEQDMKECPASPLVSVIIPTYNHANFLGRALQSVQDQTYTNWEVIVIDNHSQDDTDEVVRKHEDPRVRLLKIHNNGVIAASRNMGVRAAKGHWIAFLDSDDLWYAKKLERSLEMLESGYDLVCHGERWVGEYNGARQVREVHYGPESRASFLSLLFEGNCISTSAVVVRRQYLEMVGGFDESDSLITAEDYHLWMKLARAGARIGFIREILGEYTIHEGNSSRAALRNMHAVQVSFEKMYATIDAHSIVTKVLARRRRAIIEYGGARSLQANGEHGIAWQWFLKALVRWPFIPKFYAGLILNALHRRFI